MNILSYFISNAHVRVNSYVYVQLNKLKICELKKKNFSSSKRILKLRERERKREGERSRHWQADTNIVIHIDTSSSRR